ncbi:MAG TPA: efflux RND transporter periplasmic adaptor subunit [Bryobacteraceae bacterium]|jgi:multidrug efflux pump subunit AcrA (membrane-fusion protein)
MSATANPAPRSASGSAVEQPRPAAPTPSRRPGRVRRRVVLWIAILAVIGVVAWSGSKIYATLTATKETVMPTAKVQRGDVSLAVTARGEINGGNPEVLTAPPTGGTDMHITSLRTTGDAVKEGDVIVEFDTTEQEYKLREAESDLLEAEQHIAQVAAQREGDLEEDRYALIHAQADVKTAELEARKNPLLAAIAAKQNTLALENARDHLAQLERSQAAKRANGDAGIAIQQANKSKSESQASTAKQNIEAMTLRAHRGGYVSVRQNTNQGNLFFGQILPLFQVGDAVRPGMAVAEIPDLRNWELGAKVGELDRGHLVEGQKVDITVIALPGRTFQGHVKDLGATTGLPWDRHFEAKIALDNPSIDMRPGMSANIVVTTDEMHNVLWLPAQALFESDGRTFVYVKSGKSFTAKDVALQRRNETRVVVTGIEEGQEVALANPTELEKKKPAAGALPLPK